MKGATAAIWRLTGGCSPGIDGSLSGWALVSGALVGMLILGCLGLLWRLDSGPIQLDAFTPWLVSAIEENFGSRERVEVGGTQIERTDNGGAAVRVRDIVVRDPDGTVVASAPKAEIRVSGMSLLSGHMRAESLNLVGAALAVRIEQDGTVTVFASGADKHPIATANVAGAAAIAEHQETKQDKLAADRSAPPHRLRQCLGKRRRRCRGRRATASRRSCRGSTASANPGSMATICESLA